MTTVQTERTNEIILAEWPDQLSPVLESTAPPVVRIFGAAIVAASLVLLAVVYLWHP